MKFENTEVFNLSGALRGMRNPMNSWDKSDSTDDKLGKNDLDLAKRLIKSGPEHRKFLRQIFVSVDITAPLYWWSEFDTYKVGTCANSCSTMHKIASRHLELSDFEDLITDSGVDKTFDKEFIADIRKSTLEWLINIINKTIDLYNQSKNPYIFRVIKQLLPSSYLQKRTITMNFENLWNIYNQRKGHRLPEWRICFCNWVHTIKYFDEFFIDSVNTNVFIPTTNSTVESGVDKNTTQVIQQPNIPQLAQDALNRSSAKLFQQLSQQTQNTESPNQLSDLTKYIPMLAALLKSVVGKVNQNTQSQPSN